MIDSAVTKWCYLFQEGQTNVHDKEWNWEPAVGQLTVVSDEGDNDMVNDKTNEKVLGSF